MVLELYTWGPAFSLPSIDAQCLATITYCSLTIPKNQWDLVVSCEPRSNPTKKRLKSVLGRLPALRHDTKWVAGFNKIIDYLSKESNQWRLDLGEKDSQTKADLTAFSSFIESHGQSLLDLSLYVSSENFRSTTLPVYSTLLPWPERWLIPSQHRALAKSRTVHLNLSSLDLDDNGNMEMNRKSVFELIPDSLRYSRPSVSSLVSLPQHASRFRLDALADAWLEPLQELLGEKSFLLSDQGPSSLDCLAFAYLILAIVPVVPQPWLKDSVMARYPKLAAYVNKLVQLFRGPVGADHAMQSPWSADTATGFKSSLMKEEGSEGVLPWREPQPRGFYLTAEALLNNALDSLPIIGEYRNGVIVTQDEAVKMIRAKKTSEEMKSSHRNTFPAILAVGTTVAVMSGYLFYAGLVFFNDKPVAKKRGFSDLGEAGALLAMADFSADRLDRRSDNGTVPVAEVAVAVDEIGDS